MQKENAELAAALAGRYTLGREIGHGGMAVVYLARDLKHDRDVAIKVLHAEFTSGMSLERFTREVRISAGLQHPHILPMYDSGAAAGQVYCVMPFVRGETLRARIAREKTLPLEDALRLTSEIASALTYAHEQGVVHRDIKPENILLSDGRAIVADFGIAKAISADGGPRLTQTGLSIGTPHYMSPEQVGGEPDIDGRSDTYSLACVAYEMLAGEPPFVGKNSQAIIARQMQQDAPSVRIVRRSVPVHVDEALRKALAKQPVDRFPTASAFADALKSESAGAAAARRTTASPRIRYALVAVVAVLLAAGGLTAWNRFGGGATLDADLIAVAPFDVSATALEPWRNGLLDLLTRNLNGAGPLRAVPASVASAGWKGPGDEASGLKLGRRTAARTAIVGAAYAVGADSVRLKVSVFDVAGRRLVGDVERITASARMDRAADSMTVAILELLRHERPLGATRPPSFGPNAIEALKTYLQGEVFYRRTAWDSARALYERAVQLDTNYAMAFHRLAFVQSQRGVGLDTLVYFNAMRAGRLAHGLPERDSLIVTVDSLSAALAYQYLLPSARSSDSIRTRLRARLVSTFEVATRRIADDPEIWYAQSLYGSGIYDGRRGRDQRQFDALRRTIRLDSTFLPAYERAVQLAALLGGADSARLYLKAYLAHGPTGSGAEAARLTDALFDPRRANSPETQRMLDAASPGVLNRTLDPLFWWNDSAETVVRVARRILAHPDGGQLYPGDSTYQRFIHAMALAWRGHLREACSNFRERRNFFLPAALLGCTARDTASAIVLDLTARGTQQPRGLLPLVGWWGELRDSTQLRDLQHRSTIALGSSRDAAIVASARALTESAQAYIDLLHGDSAQALRRFMAVPDSLCALCDIQFMTKSRLLAAAGRPREALEEADQDRSNDTFPLVPVMRLQVARLAEQLGDKQKAIENYTAVADAWRRGDPAMRDSVDIARAALKRLGVRP